jgi:hypothetical protein
MQGGRLGLLSQLAKILEQDGLFEGSLHLQQ